MSYFTAAVWARVLLLHCYYWSFGEWYSLCPTDQDWHSM